MDPLPKIEGKTFDQPAKVSGDVFAEPTLEMQQATYPLAEIDFVRLEGPDSKLVAWANGILLSSVGALVAAIGKVAQNYISPQKTKIETWEWVSPIVFFLISLVLYGIGFCMETPKKTLRKSIRQFFATSPRRHIIGSAKHHEP